jgi:hypothetical protein
LLCACDGKLVPISVVFDLDQKSCAPFCAAHADCPLSCGGQVGFFAVDDRSDTVLKSSCVDFPPSTKGTLDDLDPLLADVRDELPSGTSLALELVVYASKEGCPRLWNAAKNEFEPTPDGSLPLYAGRSAVAELTGDSFRVDLPIDCMAVSTCSPTANNSLVAATVTDLDTLKPVDSSRAGALDVRAGLLYPSTSTEPFLYAFNPTVGLAPTTGDPPSWSAETSDVVTCAASTVIGSGPAVSTVSCDQGASASGTASIAGYTLPAARLAEILSGLGLAQFPDGGLLVGRVVDKTGAPVDGDTIAPAEGAMTVTYFQPDPSSGKLEVQPTGSWFAVTSATLAPTGGATSTCCEAVIASSGGTEAGKSGAPVGVAAGVVLATVITAF